jgi:Tol biopolymer transport system component
MGEVYRASDARLGRDVAIKVLPPEVTASAERLARFEREARVLASLSHPNIASIFGVEDSGGGRALVMELVQGPTLADVLAKGPIPLDEAVPIFRQIAEALEAAHEQGIVHRDLKPENIKLRPDGMVKILDFGIAKTIEATGADGSQTSSPTTTSTPTAIGVILGSAAYMAPEQAKGKPVDKRADIWAFGVILHECLTGKRLFEGETLTETLAAVLRQDVDLGGLPAATPPGLRRLLRRCLERDPKNRLHDIADARIALDEIRSEPREAAPVAVAPSTKRSLLPWVAGAFVLGAVLAAAALSLKSAPAAAVSGRSAVSFRQLTILPGGEAWPAISPDGASFAYVKQVGGHRDVFVQRVDGRTPIDVTAGCEKDDDQPAFSPDGRLIAFRSECSGGGIFVVGATGESMRKVADFGFAPAWSPDGRELAVVTEDLNLPWSRASTSRLFAVDVESGEKRTISEHDAMQPRWSPDGARIAFWGLRGSTSFRDLWTVASDGSQASPDAAVPVTDDVHLDWSLEWSPDGRHLYFASTRGGTMNLWRVGIDAGGRATGPPVPLTAPSSWVGWLSLSADGTKLAWVDRNARTTILRAPFDPVRGVLTGAPVAVPLGSLELYEAFDVSPDGRSILFADAGLPQHLFLVGIDGASLRQLTAGPHRDRQASFSPDGAWIAFQTTRFSSQTAVIRSDGSSLREIVSSRTDGWFPRWSPDGKRIALSAQSGAYVQDPFATSPAGSTEEIVDPGDHRFEPLDWSRDGRTIVGSKRDAASRRHGVVLYDLAGRSYRMLNETPDVANCRFFDRDTKIVCSWRRGIVLLDTTSGASREILAAPPAREFAYVVPSEDGRWLTWLEAGDESDIWLATLE